MKTTASRAPRKAAIVSVCVLALFLLVAPAASAGPLDPVSSAVSGVLEGDTQGSSGGSAPADDGSGLGGAVGGVVTTITETGQNATTNLVEKAGKTIDETTEPVKEAIAKLGGTVEGTAAAVTAAASESADTVRETTDMVLNPKPGGKQQGRTTDNRNRGGNNGSKPAAAASNPNVLGFTFADARNQVNTTPVAITPGQTAFVQPAGESLITQIGRIATEAAKQVAFPMLLTLLVAGFLFAQNRIDRSDPKLALAPVESDHDLLSFT